VDRFEGPSSVRRRSLQIAGLFVLGLVPGLIGWQQLFRYTERVDAGWRQLAWYALPWITWAYYTLVIRWVIRTWAPLENAGRPKWLFTHLCTLVVGWIGNELVQTSLRAWAPWPKFREMAFGPLLLDMMRGSALTDLIAYCGACGVIYGLEARRRLRAQEMAAARLEAQLARAQLEALRVQLHPHFLFNTLNAISMMVRKGETDGAVRMLVGLSDLLRLALASVGKQEVPLRQELDFLERYLALQQVRFSDRLQVKMHISPEALDARVPSLVLQPLAENAVRHGLAPQNEAGTLEIGAERSGEDLILSVRDTGVGLPPEAERRGGVGLQNVRARLAVLYPDAHRFTLENHPGGGALATVSIPFHREALADV
jgi:two-component system LytT family sensor kinase